MFVHVIKSNVKVLNIDLFPYKGYFPGLTNQKYRYRYIFIS